MGAGLTGRRGGRIAFAHEGMRPGRELSRCVLYATNIPLCTCGPALFPVALRCNALALRPPSHLHAEVVGLVLVLAVEHLHLRVPGGGGGAREGCGRGLISVRGRGHLPWGPGGGLASSPRSPGSGAAHLLRAAQHSTPSPAIHGLKHLLPTHAHLHTRPRTHTRTARTHAHTYTRTPRHAAGRPVTHLSNES